MKPITCVTIIDSYDATEGNDIHHRTDAKIDENENLVIEGCDSGKQVMKFWGDEDYEYWTTVKKEYKDTVLLLLIKDNFKDDLKFKEWLKEKNIPFEFTNWV